jgi:hypothetical protein
MVLREIQKDYNLVYTMYYLLKDRMDRNFNNLWRTVPQLCGTPCAFRLM